MTKTAKKKTKRRRKKSGIGAKIVTSLVVVTCIVSMGLMAYNIVFNSELFGAADGIGDGVDISEQDYINIMILGVDSDTTDPSRINNMLTDVIMVAHIDFVSGKINILQIPRDTYVAGYNSNKINAVYASGDDNSQRSANVANVIGYLFGIDIHGHLTITMEGFRNAIDAIDGVYMDVPFTFELTEGSGEWVTAGERYLTGEEAEWFVRYRAGYSTGDLGRIQSQQRQFVSALASQVLSLSKSDMAAALMAVFGDFSTNFTVNELLDIADKCSKIDLENIGMYMLPGEPVTTTRSYYSAHIDDVALLLNARFRTYTDPVLAADLNIIEMVNKDDFFDENGNSLLDILNGEDGGSGSIPNTDPQPSSESSSEAAE